MDGISAALGSIPPDAWFAAAATAALVAGIRLFPHARRGFHQWRLDRRLARNPTIQRDELFDYHWLICDELEPLDGPRLARDSLFAGLAMGAYATILDTRFEDWWHYGHWILLGGGLLYGLWRRLNDPPELQPETGLWAAEVPRDAVVGFGAAVVIVALVLLAVVALF